MLSSSRLLTAQGIVLLLKGIVNPDTSLPLFSLVKLGPIFDPGNAIAWSDVAFFQAKSGPAGSGGNMIGWRIEDNPVFMITSGWRYDPNSTTAQENMLATMDILNPIIHSHYQIPNPNNPAQAIASLYSLLEDLNEHSIVRKYPNGGVYLLWSTFVTTKIQYNVTLQNP